MDAVFIDKNGNKKNFLYQYDVGQTFIVENFEYDKAPKVHFSIKSIKTAPSVGSKIIDSDLHVSIPDMLLTYGENIVAYLYIEDGIKGNTVETIFISVIPRKCPAEYTYISESFARSVNGTIIAENSGITEVASWADGNTNNQDRTGYFVSVSYDAYNKSLIANKATSINDVYGVSVDKAGIALNCDSSKLDNDGDLMLKYACVCTSGFATVIDNGKCTVGKMCVPNSLGTAVASDDTVGYKVVSRIDDRHIVIFVDHCMQSINNLQEDIVDVNSALSTHADNKDNPHLVTKAQIGLGNVNNTSDINKPVSNAQSKAISDAKQDVLDQLTTKADLVDGVVPLSQLPSNIGEVSKSDFDELKNKVDSLEFSNGIVITDSVTSKQYTLGMQDGKLVVIPI